jgi:hypothetical protein
VDVDGWRSFSPIPDWALAAVGVASRAVGRLFRSIRGAAALVRLAGGRPGIRYRTHVPELVGVVHRADRLDLPSRTSSIKVESTM